MGVMQAKLKAENWPWNELARSLVLGARRVIGSRLGMSQSCADGSFVSVDRRG